MLKKIEVVGSEKIDNINNNFKNFEEQIIN